MRKYAPTLIVASALLILTSCQVIPYCPTESARPILIPSPTPWPLEVKIDLSASPAMPSCKQLLQLQPGLSSLQDVYSLVGYPEMRRDLPTGVALGYPSPHTKFKHIVFVDGKTGTVLLVGAIVYQDRSCPSFDELKSQYGHPILTTVNGRREHWLFQGKDIADTQMVLQVLPPGTSLEQYRAHNGYFEESYAFTP